MTDATELRIAVNRLSRTLRAQKADTTVTDAQFSALADSLVKSGYGAYMHRVLAEGHITPAVRKAL